ncbi:MAG: hypothetical protein KDA30_16140, partial [Phycisphaerales bacterium]|nr:hypothetical protein [Phycisphaerales bacterium]
TAEPPDARVLLSFDMDHGTERRRWDWWSASNIWEEIRFVPDLSRADATGAPLSADEELWLLRYCQSHYADKLTPMIATSSTLSFKRVSRAAVWHNMTRAGVTVFLPILFLVGAWHIVRTELRHRRAFTSQCPMCGYSLIGLAGGVCPECGHDRGAGA